MHLGFECETTRLSAVSDKVTDAVPSTWNVLPLVTWPDYHCPSFPSASLIAPMNPSVTFFLSTLAVLSVLTTHSETQLSRVFFHPLIVFWVLVLPPTRSVSCFSSGRVCALCLSCIAEQMMGAENSIRAYWMHDRWAHLCPLSTVSIHSPAFVVWLVRASWIFIPISCWGYIESGDWQEGDWSQRDCSGSHSFFKRSGFTQNLTAGKRIDWKDERICSWERRDLVSSLQRCFIPLARYLTFL